MNTIRTNILYNLIFENTKYKACGHFLGNKAFIRKNDKLAQIEFLKGNKIGNYEKNLRDITIKVKLKSESENREEIETCMSFYDETCHSLLADFNQLSFGEWENLKTAKEYLYEIFPFVGENHNLNKYVSFYLDMNNIDEDVFKLETDVKNDFCCLYFFHELGEHISAFLDFMFEQNRQLSPEEFWGNVKSNWCKKAEENMDEV